MATKSIAQHTPDETSLSGVETASRHEPVEIKDLGGVSTETRGGGGLTWEQGPPPFNSRAP
jgi:hypothetical protein